MNNFVEVLEEGDKKASADFYRAGNEIDSDTSKLFILVFPGNPGGAAFYSLFADTLYSHFQSMGFGDSVQVLVIGHASHSSLSISNSVIHSLEDQLRYKFNYITKILKMNKDNKVVLIGHSVGAWLALESAAQLSDDLQKRVISIIALFPTLMDIHTTRRAHQLSFLFTDFGMYLLATLAFLLRILLPKELIKSAATYVLRGVKDVTKVALQSSVTLVHERVALNACSMARDEMKTIRSISEKALRMGKLLRESFHIYFGNNDGWNNDGDIEKIENIFPNSNIIRCKEGHSHAFVLSSKSCVRVAEHAAEMIKTSSRFVSKGLVIDMSTVSMHNSDGGGKKKTSQIRRGSIAKTT